MAIGFGTRNTNQKRPMTVAHQVFDLRLLEIQPLSRSFGEQRKRCFMKFARTVFLIAGIYGLLVMLPQYFLEGRIGRDTPPPISHPEFYYGFIGVTMAWQVLFLLISNDPLGYRAMMIPAVLEKAVFVTPIIILFLQGRIAPLMLAPAGLDLVLGILFVIAFLKTRSAAYVLFRHNERIPLISALRKQPSGNQ
jgi:hypothetical protein